MCFQIKEQTIHTLAGDHLCRPGSGLSVLNIVLQARGTIFDFQNRLHSFLYRLLHHLPRIFSLSLVTHDSLSHFKAYLVSSGMHGPGWLSPSRAWVHSPIITWAHYNLSVFRFLISHVCIHDASQWHMKLKHIWKISNNLVSMVHTGFYNKDENINKQKLG